MADVITNGVSVKRSATTHNVPRLTLRRHVMTSRNGCPVTKKLGRPSILSYEQEEELTELIKNMVKRLFGLNHTDVRRLVYRYCKQNNIPHNFSKKTKSAGRDWFEGFLRRHPDLANRTPEPRDDNGSVGHGSSGSTNPSGSRGSRVSTRDPLTHDQVNKIPKTG